MIHGALNPFHAELSCDSCGQLPEPPRTRLTLANVAAMLPIELLVHAVVIHTDLSYLVKVLILTVTATVLVIWVAEPSASRLLRRWLHAPALHRRKKLHSAQALWHARTTLADRPGALERVTHALSCLDINILSIQVHPVRGGVLDEFVLAGPGGLTEQDLLEAFAAGGGSSSRVMPTTPIALADGQTSALSLAARIAGNPSELPLAVAELLSAEIVSETGGHPGRGHTADGTLLKIPTAWHQPIVFTRPGNPFTPAESARAHRLAELAEIVELSRR
ncbi:MAG TPA: amino acid-binding protein [Arthrobacter sp.]|nr:amino acid-binding protein [Arthrobacter sp.]